MLDFEAVSATALLPFAPIPPSPQHCKPLDPATDNTQVVKPPAITTEPAGIGALDTETETDGDTLTAGVMLLVAV